MASDLSLSAAEALALLHEAGVDGARLEGSPGARFATVAVDSRKVDPSSLFVALAGERVDGHDYLRQALEAGSPCLLASEARWPALEKGLLAAMEGRGAAVLVVPDGLRALQILAKARRQRVPGMRRIGITGSSGKTTTKEIAASILAQGHRIAVNPGNLNSDIGLSQSMFGIEAGTELGIFEMGMNRRGEMAEIAAVYEPDIALITNVGTAHIGILGTRQAIAEEKKAVFSRFDGSQLGFVGEDDDYRAFLKEGVRGEVRDFGPRSTKGFKGARDLGLDGFAVDWEGLQVRFPLVGKHNLINAIAAMALAECVGTPPRDVAAGLEAVRPLFGRSEILRGEVTVIRDCYNSNPDSAEAALEFCDSLPWEGRRAYVIGSMLELGAESDAAHARVGGACGGSKAEALFFFGEETRPAFETARAGGFAGPIVFETDFDRLGAALKAWLRRGDLVLLKASRGMALERLTELICP
jgi:UDP-N-acetylmuramoyl-tripeptide--D-alanyl-D-alanine ligase